MKKLLFQIPGAECAYSMCIRRPGNSLEELLEAFARSQQGEVFFVQIGANDGVGNDPFVDVMTRFSWRGVCVEPQPKAFAALKENYATNPRVSVENAAVAEATGTRKIFRISFSDESWASRLATLRQDVLEKQITSGYVAAKAKAAGIVPPADKTTWIREEEVHTITFADLLTKHKMPKIDALLLDVEGYEWPILKQFDFVRFEPRFIALERMHLSDEDRLQITRLLRRNRFRVRKTKQNLVALR